MRIQNNITAMNTHRMYTTNNNAITKSAEKLSSGYRINRAGDDAAGLAISEKMRSQIRGLNMASKNSQDANSLIQTAEGALQEVHSMLQRMNELANQSATGTNENFDRSQISAEFDQLKSEINDISTQTNFNNMKLLDGSLASANSKTKVLDGKSMMAVGNTLTSGASANATYTITKQTGLSNKAGKYEITDKGSGVINVKFTDAKTSDVTNTEIDLSKVMSGDSKTIGSAFKLDLSAAGMGTFEMTANSAAGAVGDDISVEDLAKALAATTGTKNTLNTVSSTEASGTLTAPSTLAATPVGSIPVIGETTFAIDNDKALALVEDMGLEAGDYTFSLTASTSGAVSLVATNSSGTGFTVATGTAPDVSDTTMQSFSIGGAVTVTVGSNSGGTLGTAAHVAARVVTATNANNMGKITVKSSDTAGGTLQIQVGANKGEQLGISIEKMNVDGLGLTNAKISDQDSASDAIELTQDAINLVSEQRSTLGAMQNRLEHKISNLDNTSENLSASESRIRDVDIAKEMTSFTKNQILSQAATAMLAQANSMPQNVLSLLQ